MTTTPPNVSESFISSPQHDDAGPRTTRLAPSPTGALHIGNARTFLMNWAIARQRGWHIIMRIEDLDGPRIKPEAEAHTLDILRWLGIDWDGPVLRQSDDLEPYRAAMRRLAAIGRTFACALTRKEIELAASAPHQGDHELRFDPALRPADPAAFTFDAEDTNYRLLTPDRTIVIDDACAGRSEQRPCDAVGDFVIWTRRGVPAYQLAVVVDDARQGVTDVVRGADLLASAARQTLLYEALGHDTPRWWHLPLVLGPDGRRLAKRHGDSRLTTYRDLGVPQQRIIGLLACYASMVPEPTAMTARDFLDRFDPAIVSHEPVVFTPEHHAWLIADC